MSFLFFSNRFQLISASCNAQTQLYINIYSDEAVVHLIYSNSHFHVLV